MLRYFSKLFIKVVAEQMKSIPKTNISFNFYHLPTSTYGVRQKYKHNYKIQTTHPISLTSFFKFPFLSFDRVFIFFVFCISSNNCNKLNSIQYAFVYHSKADIKSYSVKLLFIYSPQVFFQGYGKEVHLACLQNNYFSCTAVSICFQSFN